MTKIKTKKKVPAKSNGIKSIVVRSGISAQWEERKFKLTTEYVDAVKNLLLAELKMMREVYKETADCWKIGVANVGDMANANYLEVTFGGSDEKKWMKKQGQIFVELP